MSGLYGIYQINNSTISSTVAIDRLSVWNIAYGDGTTHSEGLPGLNIGLCPKHITSAPLCKTPILKNDNYIAVIDSIIYNRDELLFSNALPAEFSDEELLLALIMQNGFDILAGVNGDFAGAVYNTTSDELTLFRDHMGIRPILYYKGDDWTAFSSDIRGLIAIPELPANINEEWLYRIISGYDDAFYDATQFADIFWVKPASYITIRKKNQKITFDEHIYWKLGTKKIRLSSEAAYADRLRELITDSIKRRLDVFPDIIGAELSGGLDSGVIDILINRLGREGVFYSWSFSPDDLPLVPNDERQVIADICEQENIRCLYGATTMNMGPESNIGKKHIAIGLEPDWHLTAEYNYALPAYINTLIICETAQLMQSYGARVVFTGHGGDEGVSHRCNAYEMLYHHEYIHFFKYYYSQTSGKSFRFLRTLKRCFKQIKNANAYFHTPFNDGSGADDLLLDKVKQRFNPNDMPVLTFAYDAIKYVHSGNTAVRPIVAALLGAYSGAQYIFPYLDYRVIDYAVSIPRHLYLNGNQNRYIFRKAFQNIMPESLYTCTAKNNPSTADVDYRNIDNIAVRINRFRDFALKNIDRAFWEKYLNFDLIDKWATKDTYAPEEYDYYLNLVHKLNICMHHQYMIMHCKYMK